MAIAIADQISITGGLVSSALAVMSAFLYTFGLAYQQQANVEASSSGGTLVKVRAVVTSRRWVLGFTFGIVGFVLHGVALALGSLLVVQALQVSQLAFMVLLSNRLRHQPMDRQGIKGAVLVGTGLVAFLLLISPDQSTTNGGPSPWAIVIALTIVVVCVLWTWARRAPAIAAALLGTAAGIVYGVEGAMLKVASDDLADGLSMVSMFGPAVWATAAFAVLGVLLQNLSLRAGTLAAAQSSMTLATPVVSAAIGIAVFHEDVELSSVAALAAAVAAAVAVWGVIKLAQSSAASEATGPAPGRKTAGTEGGSIPAA